MIARGLLIGVLVGLLGCLLAAPLHAQTLVAAARQQVGVTLLYDGSYQRLAYPMGDVPIERGVCTDVVIRAFRVLGRDLQQLVHQDMTRHFKRYPQNWGLSRPDRNIDHRRVPNLARFFERHGTVLNATVAPKDFQPGDLVTFTLPGNLPHIGIISNRRDPQGIPLLIHNVGAGTREEAALTSWPIVGRYRYSGEQPLRSRFE